MSTASSRPRAPVLSTSMTTDGRAREGLRWGRIAGAITLVVVGWLAVVTALTFGSAPGKSIAVIGPPSRALAAIVKANGRIVASNSYFTVARSEDADFVSRLYAA